MSSPPPHRPIEYTAGQDPLIRATPHKARPIIRSVDEHRGKASHSLKDTYVGSRHHTTIWHVRDGHACSCMFMPAAFSLCPWPNRVLGNHREGACWATQILLLPGIQASLEFAEDRHGHNVVPGRTLLRGQTLHGGPLARGGPGRSMPALLIIGFFNPPIHKPVSQQLHSIARLTIRCHSPTPALRLGLGPYSRPCQVSLWR